VKLILKVVVLCLVAGMTHADTFELADPAAEIMEDLNKPKNEQQSPDDAYMTPSLADDFWGDWTREGVGNTTCKEHLSHKRDSTEQYSLNLLWLQGFVDGVAYQRFITLGDDRLSPVYEPDSLDIWIENYCGENPPDSLFQAATAFIKELNWIEHDDN